MATGFKAAPGKAAPTPRNAVAERRRGDSGTPSRWGWKSYLRGLAALVPTLVLASVIAVLLDLDKTAGWVLSQVLGGLAFSWAAASTEPPGKRLASAVTFLIGWTAAFAVLGFVFGYFHL